MRRLKEAQLIARIEELEKTGYERQHDEVIQNYSKSDQPIPPHIVEEFSNGTIMGEWPDFSGSMVLYGTTVPSSPFEGLDLRTILMWDESDEEGACVFGIPTFTRTRKGFRQGCINRISFYVSSQGIMVDGNFQPDTNLDNQWIWWGFTDDTAKSSIIQVAVKVGNGDQFIQFDEDEFKIANRALDKTNIVLDGDYEFRVDNNIATLRSSRNLRSVEIKNGFQTSDGTPMTRVTFEHAISGFANVAFWNCEPYALSEGAVPTVVPGPSAGTSKIYRDHSLAGAMVCTIPIIQSGEPFEGAFTEGLGDFATLTATRMDQLVKNDKDFEDQIAELKAKQGAGGLSPAEAKKIADDIKALEAEQAAAKKELDDLEKATRKHLLTRRAKIAPVPFLRNHGQTIKSSDGSILVDEGKVWAKTVTNAIDLPNMSYATSTIAKGKAWVAVWADKSGKATLDILGQPQGGNIGIDRPKIKDGDWTVYRKDFNVPANNINTFFSWSLQAPVGDIQGPVFYEAGKEDFTFEPYRYFGTFENEDASTQEREFINPDRVTALETKLNNLSAINVYGGDTRPDDTPFINVPDRTGARFETLEFTVRDGRKNGGGGWSYADRASKVIVPVSWLNMAPVAGRVDWTVETFGNRNSLKRRFTYSGTAHYDIWLQWRRNGTSWDVWFQGQHTSDTTKPLNQYCAVTDITANFVKDDNAVDPGLKPLVDQVADNAAKIKTNADNIAQNSLNVAANRKLINDEIVRAKGKESDLALDIATISSSLGIVSKGLADETARAKAAEAAGGSVDLAPYAKKTNLAKRIPRIKVWAAAQADLAITGTAQVNDNTASNLIPLEADLDAPVFTYIVPAGTSTIRYTMKNLVIGQRYEFIIKEGIGLASALTLPFAATKTNTPNWRVSKFFFTADKVAIDGSFTLSGSSNIQGPAVYSVPGLFVHDENLALNQVAELADVQSLRNDTDTKVNLLSGVVTPMNARITTLEGASGGKRANPAWFAAPRDFDTAYGRKVVDGKSAKTISFDFCAAGETATPMTMTLDTTGWAMSQFWGAPAKFITITPSGGSAMIVAVAAYTDGYVAIGVGAATGNALASVGKVRNVIIDGVIADTL